MHRPIEVTAKSGQSADNREGSLPAQLAYAVIAALTTISAIDGKKIKAKTRRILSNSATLR